MENTKKRNSGNAEERALPIYPRFFDRNVTFRVTLGTVTEDL